MNKNILIITGLLITNQAFATGTSGSSATCDSGALGKDDGSIVMRANYEPETINLYWFDENKNLLDVASASDSCTYGGTITIPTPPTKTGYRFTGWTVVNLLTMLDYTINAMWDYEHSRFKPIDGHTSGIDSMEGRFGVANYSDLENGEWAVTFNYGTVNGRSLCSMTSGTISHTGTPNESGGGRYCWCRATGFNGRNVSPVPWVFYGAYNEASDCASACTNECTYYVTQDCLHAGCGVDMYGSALRRAIFGQSE